MSAEAQSSWVVDADDSTFQQLAAERSRDTLVVVDFWATWCQPCRLLSPILEKLAAEYAGKFVLVKVETEKAPSIAAAFGVQSIPAVYALRNGELYDAFAGLLPEGQIRAWIDRLLPTAAEELLAAGRKLVASDSKAAEAKLREAAQLDSNLTAAPIALAELLVQQNRTDEAQKLLDDLEARGYLEPEAEKVKSQLHMAQQAGSAGDVEQLRAAAAADPKNLEARLALAKALAARRDYATALEAALAVVQTHQAKYVDPARAFMVDLFRILGDDNELVTEYRRKLSTALY